MTTVADRARLAHGLHARDTADAARTIAAEWDTPHVRGARIRAARQLRAQVLAIVDTAVVLELIEGATFEEVAAALNTNVDHVRSLYGPIMERWLDAHDPADDDAVTAATDLTATYRDVLDPRTALDMLRAWLEQNPARTPRIST